MRRSRALRTAAAVAMAALAAVTSSGRQALAGRDIFLDVRDYRPRFLDVTLS
jgi:hypothetical protein